MGSGRCAYGNTCEHGITSERVYWISAGVGFVAGMKNGTLRPSPALSLHGDPGGGQLSDGQWVAAGRTGYDKTQQCVL